jgi:Flp pilus assembly protein TadG
MVGGSIDDRTEEEQRVRSQLERMERRGAVLVEAAIMIPLFLTLVFGLLDLEIALFRKHVVSEAARQGARNATIHGYLAPNSSAMNAWGPTPSYYPALKPPSLYSTSTSSTVRADDGSDELASTIKPFLVGLDPSTVTIQIGWPDGNNALGNRVTVSVTTPYRHLIPFIFGDNTITLGATSTMTIMH